MEAEKCGHSPLLLSIYGQFGVQVSRYQLLSQWLDCNDPGSVVTYSNGDRLGG